MVMVAILNLFGSPPSKGVENLWIPRQKLAFCLSTSGSPSWLIRPLNSDRLKGLLECTPRHAPITLELVGQLVPEAVGLLRAPGNRRPWIETNGIPFWDRCTTHFRIDFSGDWDVHCVYKVLTPGQVFQLMSPWPFLYAATSAGR